MQILVKFPTRERANKWFEVIKKYILLSSDKDNTRYMVTLDENDPQINLYAEAIKKLGDKVTAVVGRSEGKIHACNRDMEQSGTWDIVVLASDDMVVQKVGWDNILRREMQECFPDTDGVLYHSDGYTKLNTMCIIGRKYYDRFSYIYHPSYKSLWCDNEFMEVADMLDRQRRFPEVLFKHEHWSNNRSVRADALMKKNEALYKTDEKNYYERKEKDFDLVKDESGAWCESRLR